MKQISSQAFISIIQLFTDFPFKSGGKLAVLWFDEIILELPQRGILSILEYVAKKEDWDTSTFQEIRRLWIPISKYIPEYPFDINPLESKNPKLFETTLKISESDLKQQFGEEIEHHPLYLHELTWTVTGLMGSINLWLELNIQNNCSFIPHPQEHSILQELFKIATKKDQFEIFSEIMIYKMPDLNSYSWDEIISLRSHPFFDAFRLKIVELHKLLNLNESQAVQNLIDEIARKDMEEMVNMFRPSPRKSLIKAIVSNIPMPIPFLFNPYSLITSGLDVKKELEISKKYGWLYFLLDLPSTD